VIQHPPKELLPPAAADCTAAKIDTHRRRELETKTITCPPKRVSSSYGRERPFYSTALRRQEPTVDKRRT